MNDEVRIWNKQHETCVEVASVSGVIGCGPNLQAALDKLHEKLMDPALGRMHTAQALYYVDKFRYRGSQP